MDTTRQDHLIERAAALLRQPGSEPKRVQPAPAQHSSALPLPQATLNDASRPRAQPDDAKKRIEMAILVKAGMIEGDTSYSRPAEEFRIVQKKILEQSFEHAPDDARARNNLIMITSPLKGEGKSFTSINLAGEIARHGDRRVLLVDIDPKAGGLRQALGLSEAPGILDIARDGRPDVAAAIVPTAADHLDVLPLGTGSKTSGELFASMRMGEVINELGRRYPDRLIIFDAPPCLSSSLPHTMAGFMGQAVLVVAANSTQQVDIEAALDLLQGCPHISLLLNKVPPWSTHSFGAYSYAAE